MVYPLRPSHLIPEGPQGPQPGPRPRPCGGRTSACCALRAAVAARCQLPRCARPGHLKTAAPSSPGPPDGAVQRRRGLHAAGGAGAPGAAILPCPSTWSPSASTGAVAGSPVGAGRAARAPRLGPRRRWRLVRIDCGLAGVDAHAPRLLRQLSPAATVMDLNIGAALWLAARGAGRACLGDGEAQGGASWRGKGRRRGRGGHRGGGRRGGRGGQEYTSAARVVLMGHGADRLCGGYGEAGKAGELGMGVHRCSVHLIPKHL